MPLLPLLHASSNDEARRARRVPKAKARAMKGRVPLHRDPLLKHFLVVQLSARTTRKVLVGTRASLVVKRGCTGVPRSLQAERFVEGLGTVPTNAKTDGAPGDRRRPLEMTTLPRQDVSRHQLSLFIPLSMSPS